MSRPNRRMRAKAKAMAKQRIEANTDPANHIQSGKVRSVVSSYSKFASLSAAPSIAYAPDRFIRGAKSVSQAHKPRQDAPPVINRPYLPAAGHESNLFGKPRKPDAFIPDVALGYTIASAEPENLDRYRKIVRMCRKARRRSKASAQQA